MVETKLTQTETFEDGRWMEGAMVLGCQLQDLDSAPLTPVQTTKSLGLPQYSKPDPVQGFSSYL